MLAAKAAGMSAYVIPNRITMVSDFREADGVYTSMAALHDAFGRIFDCNNSVLCE
jgi:hypothetical protein